MLPTTKPSVEKSRILVIDDEQIIRDLFLQTLGEGYHVETVEDGNVALEKIKGSFFNLLITDVKMPKVDGLMVLKEIKKINPYIEVIIITGYPTIESAVEAIKIGAFDFICKPFDIQAMASIVDRCLERQKFNIDHVELGELMALFEISKTITDYKDLDTLLGQIFDSALRVVKAKSGSLLLFDEESGDLRIKAARGLSEEVIRNTKIKVGEVMADEATPEGNSALTTHIDQDSGFPRNGQRRHGIKPFLSISLASKNSYSRGNVLGVININEKVSGENFTEREQALLSILASQAVIAIENYRLYSQLQDKIGDLKGMIKELEETRNQLIQSEKLTAVGHLAFGIAHEIRNPLGIILEGVKFVQERIGREDTISEESIDKIKKSVDRANKIIVDLLKFSRASKLQMQPVNVCGIMDEVASLIKNQAYLNNVQINRNYQKPDIQVMADPNMLRQAFFNLCINAIDAMPKEGQLSLNIYPVRNAERNENNVIVEIIDTGKGIPEGILPNIFNPFFTTKEPGKGTGLGLSIVHLILERHNGTVDVETKVNEGTKFTVKLPVDGNQVGGN